MAQLCALIQANIEETLMRRAPTSAAGQNRGL